MTGMRYARAGGSHIGYAVVEGDSDLDHTIMFAVGNNSLFEMTLDERIIRRFVDRLILWNRVAEIRATGIRGRGHGVPASTSARSTDETPTSPASPPTSRRGSWPRRRDRSSRPRQAHAAAGRGFRFSSAGTRTLKGIDGCWELYELDDA
jgi:hypothetical protein